MASLLLQHPDPKPGKRRPVFLLTSADQSSQVLPPPKGHISFLFSVTARMLTGPILQALPKLHLGYPHFYTLHNQLVPISSTSLSQDHISPGSGHPPLRSQLGTQKSLGI